MPSTSVYIGIDVACGRGKRLPICVVSGRQPLTPLMIPKHLAELIPRGVGNREITATAPFEETAGGVVNAIDRIAIDMGWQIKRIALDAPAAAPEAGVRTSENELGRFGLILLPNTSGTRLGWHTRKMRETFARWRQCGNTSLCQQDLDALRL